MIVLAADALLNFLMISLAASRFLAALASGGGHDDFPLVFGGQRTGQLDAGSGQDFTDQRECNVDMAVGEVSHGWLRAFLVGRLGLNLLADAEAIEQGEYGGSARADLHVADGFGAEQQLLDGLRVRNVRNRPAGAHGDPDAAAGEIHLCPGGDFAIFRQVSNHLRCHDDEIELLSAFNGALEIRRGAKLYFHGMPADASA